MFFWFIYDSCIHEVLHCNVFGPLTRSQAHLHSGQHGGHLDRTLLMCSTKRDILSFFSFDASPTTVINRESFLVICEVIRLGKHHCFNVPHTKYKLLMKSSYKELEAQCSSPSENMLSYKLRSYSYKVKIWLTSYKTLAAMMIALLLLGLVSRSLGDFSLSNMYSFREKPTVSYPMASLQHGIMFDAGSTGSRIHVFSFRKLPDGTLSLANEVFKQVKPGLSAFANNPKKGAKTIYDLLQKAKDVIPVHQWHATPVALKATAGLRLLPVKSAKHLLHEVYEVFSASPFNIPAHQPHCVSIMDGLDEGIFAWVTVNFLTGGFHKSVNSLMGALDLGGGSTQVTFHPLIKATVSQAPKGFIQSVGVFGSKYILYSHSYLGLGLMSARGAIMAQGNYMLDSQGENVSHTPCLPVNQEGTWSFGGQTHKVRGHSSYSFELCLNHAKNLVQKVNKNDEMNQRTFYTFSYYYDRAVELGLIDEKNGGIISVEDYVKKTKEVCSSTELRSNPLLCMDATYIIALLMDGYGFKQDRQLILRKKIDGVELSWALGATLDMFDQRNKKTTKSA